jgi:hypothetical protein
VVEIPSINPACQRKMKSTWYMQNAWCPRCTWKGRLLSFVYPREWQEPGPAITCREGQTGQVIRIVRMPWKEKYNYTTESLWTERRRYRKLNYDFSHLQAEKIYAELSQSPEQLALMPIEQRYFIRAPQVGHEQNSPEFYYYIDDVQWLTANANKLCPICRGNINLGVNHEDSCLGGDFVDSAGNRIYGNPVGLPCNHFFGLGCIRQWIEGDGDTAPINNHCPVCRTTFDFQREVSYYEPIEWADEYAWDMSPMTTKILYVPQQAYRRATVWYWEVLGHLARIQHWQQILSDDWNHRSGLARVLLDYCTFLIMNSLCLSHPFWMSTTNILLATIGLIVFWWARPRPLDATFRDYLKFRLYFWVSFLGNLTEWVIDNQSRGWFTRPVNFLWVFIYFNYFGFLVRNIL